jgi:ribosomal protein L12E/L44/L45/RPP1/RPP2
MVKDLLSIRKVDSWERCREIHKDQLLVIYTKFLKEKNAKLEEEAIKTFIDIFSDKDVFINKSFIDQTIVNRPAAAPQQTAKTASGAPAAAVQPRQELRKSA